MSVESPMTAAANEPPTPLVQLRATNAQLEMAREAISEMMRSVSRDDPEWTAALTDPDVLAELGALFMLAPKGAAHVVALVNHLMVVLAGIAPQDTEKHQAAFIAGQVRVEISCNCGLCAACDAKQQVGPEVAAKNIEAALNPRPKRERLRLVATNGKRFD